MLAHRSTPPAKTRDKVVRSFLVAVLVLSLVLALYVVWPFADPLIMGAVMATLFYPLQRLILRRLPGKRNLAALTTVLLITLVIVIPVLLFLAALINQGIEMATRASQWLGEVDLARLQENPRIAQLLAWMREYLPFVQMEGEDLRKQLVGASTGLGQALLKGGTSILGNVLDFFVNFSIMLFLTFYFLRDGKAMVNTIKHLSPLRSEQEERILARIKAVTRSVFLGSFLTAVCQGLAGGIAMAIVGIPPLFWGTVLGLASLVPVVGTALVWVPATAYLVILGSYKSAVFFAAWCAIIVGSIDNFLRPFLMHGQAQMSPFYIFLAIIGGLQVFGLAGVLYGPLIIAFATVMLYIYRSEYHEVLDEVHEDTTLLPPEDAGGG